MLSRYEALLILETDVLLADDRKDCVDVVRRRLNQIYDSFEKSNEVWQSAYQQGLNERRVLDKNKEDIEDETRL